MDLFLGLLVLSGLITLVQLLLPGKSGRGIGIAQWLSWIALATAMVAFLGSGRAGETFNRITGNFVDRPAASPTISPTISPIPIESSPNNPSLTNPPPTSIADSPASLVAIEGWYQIPQTIQGFLPQPSPVPSPSPVPNPFPTPTPAPQPSPSPNPVPPPIPTPSPNPVPPPIPPSPTPQPPIPGLW